MSTARLLGGRYEVGELIGRGGMAEVHLGYDTRLDRPVALKLLRTDLARDSNFLTRFRREAQAAGGLNHPSIVAIFDSGEDTTTDAGGASAPLPYIVMEHVDGETLRAKLSRENVIAPSEAARITEGVLAALAYSHRMGIVHRDIKPANVMLTRRGDVKVMDFGIARAMADTSATMTQTQAVIGTAQYLSPEQAQGLPVDARSDLYSTGCMLFELLTGQPPFVGDSAVSVAYQHVGEPARRPSSLNHDVPTAYDDVTLHALAKNREHRYQSATEFRNDLVAAREGRPLIAATAGAAVAALAGAGGSGGGAGEGAATQLLGPRKAPDTQDPLTVGRDPDQDDKRSGWVYAAIVVGVLVLLAGAVWGGVNLFSRESPPDQVAVPRVVGLTSEAARAALTAKNLAPQVNNVTNNEVPKGTVVAQNPKEGTNVNPGSTVSLDVSTGPGEAGVGNVVGFTQDAAITALRSLGFTVSGIVPVNDNAQQKGNVVSTDPAVGAVVPLTTPITLRVATGQVPVPDVRTKNYALAQDALTKLGLLADLTQVPDANAVEGTVLDQSPATGTIVDVGSRVTLKVAQRPTTPPTTVTVTQTATAPPTTPATTTRTTPPTTSTTSGTATSRTGATTSTPLP
ncbi:MAG: Stk1 family PASTA domain-containing Ser/Thr kinase [Actinomycetota bacterium]|nr:Stk1 family PASTA domain-containing Ser/Thr kinase [Actinomycetota bacterium]